MTESMSLRARMVPKLNRGRNSAKVWVLVHRRGGYGEVLGAAQFLIFLVAGWLARQQGEAIEYLRAQNRVLRSRLSAKQLRLTDAERRLWLRKASRWAESGSRAIVTDAITGPLPRSR